MNQSSSRKIPILWNPNAGPQERNAASLEQIKTELGSHVEVHVTKSEQHSAELTRQLIDQGATCIAAAGGDGVINVVSDAILQTGKPNIALAVLPSGTGNDYARSLGLPLSAVEAAPLILTENPRRLDVFQLHGKSSAGDFQRYGANMLAGGNTGQYTQQLTDEMKQQWGAFCFLRGAIEVLNNLEVYPVEVQFDDEPPQQLNVLNLFVANGRCAGAGLPVAPNALLDDGLLDAVIVLDGTGVQLAQLALTYVVGDPHEHDLILARKAKKVTFRSQQPFAWAVDGQEFTASELTITVHPSRLPVILGPQTPAVQSAVPTA
ncbi:Lipid kinase YegS [Anatilimnocola aggregata]|uniref:Lipid kinase YegS n=1 Tax=Anatilimnocola aggregata TaxID=2528021 RepID=A0A517YAY3_9BACT|nr:YegS/Rv2252/BmrU family lipid kinase [Anatilimnocola aggregata]QDU27396.1 Lipid kinase YegS [Anatilimnocola aggregata]